MRTTLRVAALPAVTDRGERAPQRDLANSIWVDRD